MNYLSSALAALSTSKRAVVQVSGGRDSRAMLELVAPHLRETDFVVMLLTGDSPSDTLAFASELEKRFENVVVLQSDSVSDRRHNGHPSPVVLSDQPVFADVLRTRSQFDCCFTNIMLPLHKFTLGLQPDLILRGQRISDEHKNPIVHLGESDGILYAYPIADWADEQVDLFLADRLPAFYKTCSDAPDCMSCTGYWGRGYQEWLDTEAPDLAAVRKERIRSLIQAITPALLLGIQEVK